MQTPEFHPRSNRPAIKYDELHLASLMKTKVDQNESVLMVNGYPFMPKIIEHNGESLEFLHSLGFNTVALKQFPPAGN